ncbi:LysR family transcriptional regulator [Yokenella regensburgei]|uniref:LysR family transcriptional regulator n=1 Tax=Yokenella regensburgei TaxID=158877 RepID=A0ABX9RXP9_9ENTR|nr:LysR substrate-binding domain-containing protein [Yokenella regensburgei]RKR54692.1 LysR family transcriptional regulator [Yokenella regensburgei]VFS14560.1 Gcv operon activator [Yokenella regensburgei]
MNSLPPLKALQAFEASVRLGSFLNAASALHVTPGAISQLVKKLENQLNVQLFIRDVRRLTVTEAGLEYYRLIVPALAQLAAAGEAMQALNQHRLTFSMPPGVAAQWFSARMPALMAAFPGTDLHLNATSAVMTLERDNIDIAIRYFDGRSQQGPLCQPLWDDECRVYANPQYLQAQGLRSPEDVVRATLLHTTMYPDWNQWLMRYTSLTEAQRAAIPGIHVDQTLLAIDAARRGQGVLICHPQLVNEALKQGALTEIFNAPWHSGKGFWLLINPRKREDKRVLAVVEWLRGQA